MNRQPPHRLASSPDQQTQTPSGGFASVLGGVIWFATAWMLLSAFALPVARSLWSRSWEETTCVIGSSRDGQTTSKVRGFSVETKRVHVSYRYVVSGREYSSERHDFADGDRGSEAYELAQRLTPGARVPCFYDPDDPSDAVLDRYGFGGALMGFLVQMQGAVGMFLYRDGLRDLEKRRPRPGLRSAFYAGTAITVVGLVLGFGLSVFAGAPLWAWLVMSALPVALWQSDRWIEARERRLDPPA